MSFEVGQRFGDYEVVKMLGVGGMGHVYLVRNIISNRTEAMKVLLPDLNSEQDLAVRFIAEIRTLASFDHPNIAQLRTAFQANNQLIMIMEFVEGSTLEQMTQGRPLTVPEVADYISQGLSALSYAHAHGVVHRDIKPANLMVTSHGIVKLMDFGISKSTIEDLQHTRPGTTIGSLHYMSPEQVRGGAIDARSDLYSVGVVLYELTAGRRPFDADTTYSILNQQLNIDPTPPIEINPQLPPELNRIIMTALAKDPANRFQTAEDFRDALKTFRTSNAPIAAAVLTPASPAPAPPAPIPMPVPATAAAASQLTASSAPPPFSPVPNTAPPSAYSNAAPQYSAPAQTPYSTPLQPAASVKRSGGHRTLWIATGALMVLLLIVGLGFALPHFISAIAGSRNTPAATASQPPAATSTPEPQPVATTAPLDTGTPAPSASPSSITQPASNFGAPIARSNPGPSPRNGSSQPVGSNRVPVTNLPVTSDRAVNQPGPQPASGADIEEAQTRLTQMLGRSNAARRGVARIRSQQEASGLSMRGDIEASDSRLGSYLSAAGNAISRGDPAAAQRAMDKAETDLATVEKFLGY